MHLRGMRPRAFRALHGAISLLSIAASPGFALAVPDIAWNPTSVTQPIAIGEAKATHISFIASESISGASVSVAPELRPYITISPVVIGTLPANQKIDLTLIVSASASASPGSFNGTVQIRSGSRTIAKPLPVTVSVFARPPGASSDGTSLAFTSATGATLFTVPLTNGASVLPSPDGAVTTTQREQPIISDDRTRAGIFSTKLTTVSSKETEGRLDALFSYYGPAGLLWQFTAPAGAGFWKPLDPDNRLLTPGGSRIFLVTTSEGDGDARLSVHDAQGNTIYLSPPQSFLSFYQGQISPNGKYVLAVGSISGGGIIQDLVRVTDIDANRSFDLGLSADRTTAPDISVSGDGRFLISVDGSQVILPPTTTP
jgi:hypothetical protein